ncbi:diguanylate cyclase [Rhabdothermincola salaria]|uniref:diguanylate cyclase n=1 Tax=Rhabdothermincola salaria TaxID=2903142 RepID=UPI001E48B09B|nr:diguanylate cyclase [Rhabdothermincola salaria]MCD9624014.1 diguanylate cyclase [Rhabdothermincola salaria]
MTLDHDSDRSGSESDAADRDAIERQLQRSAALLDAAVRASGIGIWSWDHASDGELSWSPTMYEIFGVARGAPVRLEDVYRLCDPNDRERVLDAFWDGHQLVEGEVVMHVEHPVRGRRSVLMRSRVPEPGALGLVGVAIDVTDTRAEADRVAEILDAIPTVYIAIDADWRITYLNRKGAELFRVSAPEIEGRDLWEVFPHAVGTEFEAAYRRVADGGPAERFEASYPSGLWFDVQVQALGSGICVYLNDVTDRRRLLAAETEARREAETASAELAFRATHDVLTGLPNRTVLLEFLEAVTSGSSVPGRDGPAPDGDAAVLFVDLDDFKIVNDTHGHEAGDQLLRVVAERLSASVRETDMVARLGGDEFVVAATHLEEGGADALAERILASLNEPVEVDLDGSRVVVSTGASVGLRDVGPGMAPGAILRDADLALYRAKGAGRNRAVRFRSRHRRELLDRVAREERLREMLDGPGVALDYQLSYRLRDGVVTGLDPRVRWAGPEGRDRSLDVRPPGPPDTEVWAVAREAGLVGVLGEAVMERALGEMAPLFREHPEAALCLPVTVAQLVPGFADELRGRLRRLGLTVDQVGVKVPEAATIQSLDAAAELFALDELGVRIAVADFGTGSSSLARLTAFPVHVVRIDEAFTVRAARPDGGRVLSALVGLGHAFGAQVMGEGIDTPEILDAAVGAGVDLAVGAALHEAAPATALDLSPVLARL